MNTRQEFYPAQGFSFVRSAETADRQVEKYLRAYRSADFFITLARVVASLALALAALGLAGLLQGRFIFGWVLFLASFVGVVGRLLLVHGQDTRASLDAKVSASQFLTETQKSRLLDH